MALVEMKMIAILMIFIALKATKNMTLLLMPS
jgi:hypothetical protein